MRRSSRSPRRLARRPRGAPPLDGAPDGAGGQAALPGTAGHHRPGDRERLLLRLQAPERASRPRTSSASRTRCGRSSGENLPVRREELPRARGDRALPRAWARTTRSRSSTASPRRHRLALPPGRLRRSLPRPARARHRPHRRLQADQRRRRVLARRRAQRDAPAHLRHRLRRRQKDLDAHLTRIEEAKQRDHRRLGAGARSLPLPPDRARLAVLPPEGRGRLQPLVDYIRGALRDATATPRSSRRSSSGPSCARPRATTRTSTTTCSSMRGRRGRVRREADELPGPLLSASRRASTPTATCRSASPTSAACTASSARARCTGLTRVRSIAQDDAHIYCTPEQVDAEIERFFAMTREVYGAFGFDRVEVSVCDAAREVPRASPSCGTPPRRRSRRALRARRLSSAPCCRARAPSTAPKIEFDFRDVLERSLDARDDPDRLRHARALRARATSRRDGSERHAGDAAPRDPRLARALHRDLPRAHRRRLPALAGAGEATWITSPST